MRHVQQKGSTSAWGAGIGLLALLIVTAIGMWMYSNLATVSISGSRSAQKQAQSALESVQRQVEEINRISQANVDQVEKIKRDLEAKMQEENKQIGAQPPAAATAPATQPASAPATPPPAEQPAAPPPKPSTSGGQVNELQKKINDRYKDLGLEK